jgi:uncharacterized protein YbjQ (UPF0145 family)
MVKEYDNLFTQYISGIKIGKLITVTKVKVVHIGKDAVEHIKGFTGGNLNHYTKLIDEVLNEATQELLSRAKELEYDGVVGYTVAHPLVVDSGVEIVVYGNGFNYMQK